MSSHNREVIDLMPPVPSGKVRLCEYGQQPPGSLAEDVILAFCPRSTAPAAHPVDLVYRSRGYTPAGSCLRWNDKEIWGVVFKDDRNNTTYGRWYASRPEAEDHWDQVTPAEYHSEHLYGSDDKCAHNIACANGGGIKCTKCGGWFCY